MKPINRLLIASFFLAQSFYVSAQETPLPAYFPADAKTIIHINLPSLATKMSWQELQQLSFIDQTLKDAPPHIQELLKDPSTSGINFQGGLFIAILNDPKSKTKPSPVLYGQLADPAKFAATVQKISPKQKVNTVGKIKVLTDNKHVFAWTSNVFVAPFKNKEVNPPMSQLGKTGPATKTATAQTQLIKQCQLLLMPSAKSITTDSRFTNLLNEGGDIRLWINRNMEKPKGKIAKKEDEMLKMMNWGMMQQGNYMAGVVNFENGKAVMSIKSYMNKTMDSVYRLYPSMNLNSSVFKKLPPGQPIALISFTMSPEMIKAMMKAAGTEKMMDSLAKKSAVKPMEIAEGLNGDITLAVIKTTEYDEKDSITAALKGLQIFAAASVKSKEKLEPLFNLLQKPKKPATDEEGSEVKRSGPLGGMKPSFLLTDSFFVLSISPFAAEKFLATSGENGIASLAAPYINNASLFSLDLKAIINFAMQMGKKKNKNQDASKMLDALDRLVLYGGKYENGAALTTAELQFANKEENSLKQLIKLVETVMSMEKKKSKPENPDEEPAQ